MGLKGTQLTYTRDFQDSSILDEQDLDGMLRRLEEKGLKPELSGIMRKTSDMYDFHFHLENPSNQNKYTGKISVMILEGAGFTRVSLSYSGWEEADIEAVDKDFSIVKSTIDQFLPAGSLEETT